MGLALLTSWLWLYGSLMLMYEEELKTPRWARSVNRLLFILPAQHGHSRVSLTDLVLDERKSPKQRRTQGAARIAPLGFKPY